MRYIKPAVLSTTDAISTIKAMAKSNPQLDSEQPSVTASYEADE